MIILTEHLKTLNSQMWAISLQLYVIRLYRLMAHHLFLEPKLQGRNKFFIILQ